MTPTMSASFRKSRRILDPQEAPLDPDDLTRRLDKVIAEDKARQQKALERKRSKWESQLLEARREQPDRVRSRTVSAPSFEPTYAKRESVSLAPDQMLPLPPVCDDPSPLPEPARKRSMPSLLRPAQGGDGGADYLPALWAAPAAPRRPSTVEMNLMRLRRDSMLDLETIDEVCRDGGKEKWGLMWTLADRPRKRSSVLTRVEDCAPTLDHAAHGTDGSTFHSGESTMINSWRSSFRSSVGSRKRSSILKRVESYWIVKSHHGEDQSHPGTVVSSVEQSPAPRKPNFNFFSKLKV